ncbi:MAG: hypothetical protein HY321_16655 [Armatimonadetes bacterium]|nr:hypothetical protein [Armatimonadota bacterium]
MRALETVLGSVAPEEVRICLPHEHFNVHGPNEASIGIRDHALAVLVPQLEELRERYDCNALVECTSVASNGRDLETYAAIARQARFHVIASTGFFLYERTSWWMKDASVQELAERWTREARQGMDGTGIRPGVLKGASGMEIGDPGRPHHAEVRTWFEALARTHHATGLPITTHASGPASWPQFAALTECGVPPRAIAVGHADFQGSVENLLPVLDHGGYVLHNFCGGFQPRPFDAAIQLIKALIDRGYTNQLLISVDVVYSAGRRCDMLTRTGATGETPPWLRDYRHIFTHVIPRLEEMGVTPAQIRQLFHCNPKAHLCGPW